jgi:hypothetical protein
MNLNEKFPVAGCEVPTAVTTKSTVLWFMYEYVRESVMFLGDIGLSPDCMA